MDIINRAVGKLRKICETRDSRLPVLRGYEAARSVHRRDYLKHRRERMMVKQWDNIRHDHFRALRSDQWGSRVTRTKLRDKDDAGASKQVRTYADRSDA